MKQFLNQDVSQLTEYQRKVLNKHRVCVFCGKRIHDYDPVAYFSRRDGRYVEYVFMHQVCYEDSGEYDPFF